MTLSPRHQEPLRATIRHDLAAIWSDLLSLNVADHDASFLALGGDSIFVIHLASQIEDRFGVVLPPVSIFEFQTIVSLADEIETQMRVASGDTSPRDNV